MFKLKFFNGIILLITLSLIGLVFFIYQKYHFNYIFLEKQKLEINDKQNTIKKLNLQIDSLHQQIDSLKANSLNINKKHLLMPDYLNNNIAFIPNLLPIDGAFALSQDYSKIHNGIDFASSTGHNVVASASGIVTKIYHDKYFGKVIIIDHLNHYKTFYSHLDSYTCKLNDFVHKGDVIAKVGNTGNSTNPHLHFQIFSDNNIANPHDFITIPKFKIQK